jgi:hypothetical protein
MKKSILIILLTGSILCSCKKEDSTSNSGTVTIDNKTYQSTTYYVYGFSFSKAEKVSTLENPGPDILLYVIPDAPSNRLTLQADNLNPSFYKVGDYPDAQTAVSAFDDLKTVGPYQWAEMADPINDNQVWVFRTGSECYAKIRIISTVNDSIDNRPHGECTFEWLYQADGSTTFPGK